MSPVLAVPDPTVVRRLHAIEDLMRSVGTGALCCSTTLDAGRICAAGSPHMQLPAVATPGMVEYAGVVRSSRFGVSAAAFQPQDFARWPCGRRFQIGGGRTISSQCLAFTQGDVRSVVERDRRHTVSLARSGLIEAERLALTGEWPD